MDDLEGWGELVEGCGREGIRTPDTVVRSHVL
jgi:hypothetical protein